MKYMKGVQTQSENEESWLCVINTSKNAPVRDTSLPQKEQPTEVWNLAWIKSRGLHQVKDIQSRVELTISEKQGNPNYLWDF